MKELKELNDRLTREGGRVAIEIKWAIRTLEWMWPVEFAAQMMGHSVEVHTKTYQPWITREKKQQILNALTQRKGEKI